MSSTRSSSEPGPSAEQHTHPFDMTTMPSFSRVAPASRKRRWSIDSFPNSLTMTTTRCCCGSSLQSDSEASVPPRAASAPSAITGNASKWFSSVVFPAPRNPVTSVIGIIAGALLSAPSRSLSNGRQSSADLYTIRCARRIRITAASMFASTSEPTRRNATLVGEPRVDAPPHAPS